MDKYHIYEEIGVGKHSQVYKGREKKTIEFVAIKRVEKSEMAKVVNEVQILHRLSCPLILKFHDWYETRNNLWLILEYCTGGDLKSLVKQDQGMPEASVRRFGVDLVSALSYLHEHSILHCDLKPSNVLIDEHGVLKIKGFGDARKIPKIQDSDSIKKEAIRSSMNGTVNVLYMAPELFIEGGIHSYASDFWSLGCVLYELFLGTPAFSSTNLAVLINQVLSEDPPELSGEGKLGSSSEFEDLLLGLLSKESFDRFLWNELVSHAFWGKVRPSNPDPLPPQPLYEQVMQEWLKADDAAEIDVKQFSDTNTLGATLRASVNVMSLVSEKQIPSETAYEEVYAHGDGRTGDSPERANTSANATIKPNTTPDQQSGNRKSASYRELRSSNVYGRTQASVKESSELVAPSVITDKVSSVTEQNIVDRSSEDTVAQIVEQIQRSPPIEQMLLHPNDLKVKPIVTNALIRPFKEAIYDADALPFQEVSPDIVPQLSEPDMEAFLTVIYKALNSGGPSDPDGVKLQTVGYLQKISRNPGVAYVLINSPPFLNLLFKMVFKSESLVLRAEVAFLFGLFVQYTKFIAPAEDGSEDTDLLCVLLHLAHCEDVETRHNTIAALGELLYYISTQEPTEEELNEGLVWTIPNDAITTLMTCINSGDTISQHYASKCLENIYIQGTDEYTDIFLVETLGVGLANICLGTLRTSTSQTEEASKLNLQTTACSALVHFLYRLYCSPSVASAQTWENLDLRIAKDLTSLLVGVVADGQDDALLKLINVFNTALQLETTLLPKFGCTVTENEGLLMALLKASEHASSGYLRAKCLVGLTLMLRHRPERVALACEHRLWHCCTRPAERPEGLDPYLVAAAGTLLRELGVAGLLGLRNLHRALVAMAQHGNSSQLQFSATQCSSILPLLSSAMVRAQVLNGEMLQNLSACIEIVARIESQSSSNDVWGGVEDITALLLSIVEVISHHTKNLISNSAIVLTKFFPSLCRLLSIQRTDKRALSIALLRALVPSYLGYAINYQELVDDCAEFFASQLIPEIKILLDDIQIISNISLSVVIEILETWDVFSDLLQEANIIPQFVQLLRLPEEGEAFKPSAPLATVLLLLLELGGPAQHELFRFGIISNTASALRFSIEKKT